MFKKESVFYGHRVAGPFKAPSIGPERHNCVAPEDFDFFLAQKGKQVSITFDDGYLDNLTTALPILEKHGVKAEIFITTGFVARTHVPMERVAALVANKIGYKSESIINLLNLLGLNLKRYAEPEPEPEPLYRALRGVLKQVSVAKRIQYQNELIESCGKDWNALLSDMLTPEQVAELDNHPLITIGVHTVSHPNLRQAENEELKAELTQSKKTLEEWIGRQVTEMAYPYGANDKRVRRAVAEAGYQRAYTTEPNWKQFILAYCPLCKPRHDLSLAIKKGFSYK